MPFFPTLVVKTNAGIVIDIKPRLTKNDKTKIDSTDPVKNTVNHTKKFKIAANLKNKFVLYLSISQPIKRVKITAEIPLIKPIMPIIIY